MALSNKIQFVTVDPDAEVANLKAKYEALTGKILQPGQVEMLIINAIAYRLSLVMNQINEAANGMLVAFAASEALDKLGELVGVIRLPSAPASCVMRFQLVAGHGALSIPAGIRVQSTDGQAIFKTTETVNVVPADDTVDIAAECTNNGKAANGYDVGDISVILDPQPYVSTAQNIDASANGTDDETDEELRDRIRLAPSQFSVAGPDDAYKFWAKSAHPNIVDVSVTIGHDPITDDIIPGQVDIFPLMADGGLPSAAIIDAIQASCSSDKRRPLTDTVLVKAPTVVDYAIAVELTLLTSAVQADTTAQVQSNLEAYRDARKDRLGIDVVRSQISAEASIKNQVYKVNVVSPSNDIALDERQYGNCTGITVTVVGTHDE
jgi:phage-related baseplate assembly protein